MQVLLQNGLAHRDLRPEKIYIDVKIKKLKILIKN
jgi:hypothetical protein